MTVISAIAVYLSMLGAGHGADAYLHCLIAREVET